MLHTEDSSHYYDINIMTELIKTHVWAEAAAGLLEIEGA